MTRKSQEEECAERAVIVGRPASRPYGARFLVHLQTAASVGHLQGVCLLLPAGPFVTLSPSQKAPWEGGDKFSLELEGFPTASMAECSGWRLVGALLWTAVNLRFSVRFEHQGREPFAVYQRLGGSGLSMRGHGTVGWSSDVFLAELRAAYETLPEPDPRLLLSMEILVGARVETSDRARFLACISALEPLAAEQSLGDTVSAFVEECVDRLQDVRLESSTTRSSLEGRLHGLRKESVRQAILRVVSKAVPDDTLAVQVIDDAYNLRSQILHNGRPDNPDTDLSAENARVEAVLRKLYANRLGLPLRP